MRIIDPIAVRAAFAAGTTYQFVVPSDLHLGMLEDLLAELANAGSTVAGYDVHPHRRGCVVELHESGDCMVDADLMHLDLRLLMVGDLVDHFVEFDDASEDALTLVEADDGPTGVRGASSLFQWFEAFLPMRYTNEEFGDAEEQINRRREAGCSPWWVRVKITTTIVWVLVHIALDEYARFKRALRL